MQSRLALFSTLVALLTLGACTRTATGHVYNLTTGQMFPFTYTFNGRGRGKITAVMSDENLAGEYSVVQGGSVGWGTVYASVYSSAGTSSGNANSLRMTAAGCVTETDFQRRKNTTVRLLLRKKIWDTCV